MNVSSIWELTLRLQILHSGFSTLSQHSFAVYDEIKSNCK